MKNINYNHSYFKKRDHLDPHIANSLLLYCKKNNIKSVLDVGCGTGKLVEFLNSHGIKAKGCDKFYKSKKIIQASATKLPFKNNSFDLVASISVIEHLSESEASKFAHEANRVLSTNGHIFLITPNLNSPFRNLRDEHWFAYTDPTHVFYYTPQTMINFLLSHGFNFFKFRFDINKDIHTDLPLPAFIRPLPRFIKQLIMQILISSPFSTMRDSFWVAAKKVS